MTIMAFYGFLMEWLITLILILHLPQIATDLWRLWKVKD